MSKTRGFIYVFFNKTFVIERVDSGDGANKE